MLRRTCYSTLERSRPRSSGQHRLFGQFRLRPYEIGRDPTPVPNTRATWNVSRLRHEAIFPARIRCLARWSKPLKSDPGWPDQIGCQLDFPLRVRIDCVAEIHVHSPLRYLGFAMAQIQERTFVLAGPDWSRLTLVVLARSESNFRLQMGRPSCVGKARYSSLYLSGRRP